MFTFKPFGGPRPSLGCALESLGQSLVRVKKFRGQHPQGVHVTMMMMTRSVIDIAGATE